jgi:hypothetical protein
VGIKTEMNGNTINYILTPCPKCGTCSLKTLPDSDVCADVDACTTFARTKETYGGAKLNIKGPNDD